MSSPADTSVLILPPSLRLFFLKGDILMSLLSFCPSDTLKQSLSILSPPSSEMLTLYNRNRRKTEMLCIRRGEGLLLWCFQTGIFPPPLNFAGILAAAAGSSEDTAALGKQPFFSCLLIEVALFQKPRGMKYHRGNHKTDLWWMLTRLHSHSVLRRLSSRCIETKPRNSVLPLLCLTFVTPFERKQTLNLNELPSPALCVASISSTAESKTSRNEIMCSDKLLLEICTYTEVRQLMQSRNRGGGRVCRGGADRRGRGDVRSKQGSQWRRC